jgi:hypothetical protein
MPEDSGWRVLETYPPPGRARYLIGASTRETRSDRARSSVNITDEISTVCQLRLAGTVPCFLPRKERVECLPFPRRLARIEVRVVSGFFASHCCVAQKLLQSSPTTDDGAATTILLFGSGARDRPNLSRQRVELLVTGTWMKASARRDETDIDEHVERAERDAHA